MAAGALFALKQAYDLYQFHHQQIAQCDQMIASRTGQTAQTAPETNLRAPSRATAAANRTL